MTRVKLNESIECPFCGGSHRHELYEGENECEYCDEEFEIEILVNKPYPKFTPEQLEKMMGFKGTQTNLDKLTIRKEE